MTRLLTDSKAIIRALEAEGWRRVRTKGDHHQFQHPTRPGTVTVQHPDRDLRPEVVRSIERQSGLRLRR